MEFSQQFPLQNHNSFNVKAICPTIYFPKSIKDLEQLPDLSMSSFYILGDGSNTLFVDHEAPIIIKPQFKGINIYETPDRFTVKVGAAENWHELVCTCLAHGIFGLENLALIPGSVGAAPVQNIGAYGVDFSDFCTQITWYEFSSKIVKKISAAQCKFAYRDSIFKQELQNKGLIVEVELSFAKAWQPNLSYAGISELDQNTSAKELMETVIRLRQSKLPDPDILPNAGSFFKNPLISTEQFARIQKSYPNIPFYLQSRDLVKLAAGWLIEHVGLKGYCVNGVGVHEHQALVLVNYESERGGDIAKLAKYVQQKVLEKFDILIFPEVRMVTKHGEQKFADLSIERKQN